MFSNKPPGQSGGVSSGQGQLPNSLLGLLLQNSCYQLSLENLPPRANTDCILRYLVELESTGADAAIILYNDGIGCKEVARYDKRGSGKPEEPINIQSTTKAIFMLYLIDLMKDELWTIMDKPIGELLGPRRLQEMNIGKEFNSAANEGFEQDWERVTLRQLLNHAGEIPFNENRLASEKPPTTRESRTRYSNIGVELVSVVVQECERKKHSNSSLTLKATADAFLDKNFQSPVQPSGGNQVAMKFELFTRGEFHHLVASGKIEAPVSRVAALPVVVRKLDEGTIAKLFTPISKHNPALCSGINRYPELGGENVRYWGHDLNPDVISNLFFLRSYGYATRGSGENNCDVVIQDYDNSASAEERAKCVKHNPYFTVVRLQKSETTHPVDLGANLQKLLKDFFT